MTGKKLSHTILFVEMLMITWPVCVLIFLFSPWIVLGLVIESPNAATVAIVVLYALSILAIVGEVKIFYAYFHAKSRRPAAFSPLWWLFSAAGALIVLGALATILVLGFSPYKLGKQYDFLTYFALFVIGLPLIVPLLHMALDLKLRDTKKEQP